MKRVIGLLLAILVAVASFTGCSNSGGKGDKSTATGETQKKGNLENLNTEGMFPIVKDKIKMSILVQRPANGNDSDKLWFWKWAEKNTNIQMNVIQVEDAAWNEKKGILFASGDLPDMFLHTSFTNDDILRYGQVEKSLTPLNDLIEKYAPRIKKTLDSRPADKAGITCPDGNIYTLPSLVTTEADVNTLRTFINTKWMNHLGISKIDTLDDLYNVLKAFKEKDPNGNGKQDEIPWSGSWMEGEGYSERAVVLTALGFVTTGFSCEVAVKDGKVVLPEADPLYTEYLRYFNKLFQEGLIDKDIFTQKQIQYRSKSAQKIVGMALDGAPFQIVPNGEDYKEYSALKPLTSKWNSKPMWPQPEKYTISRFEITKSCKYPEAAIKWADMFFDEEVSNMFWAGPQKDSKNDVGSVGWVYDEKAQKKVYTYPVGIDNDWDYQNKVLSPINGYQLGFVFNTDNFNKFYNLKTAMVEKEKLWRDSFAKEVAPYYSQTFPKLFLTKEQLEKKNQLFTPLKDYVTMMEAKFITGAESLDNMDKYYSQLKTLKADEYVKVMQDAYDTYKKNLK